MAQEVLDEAKRQAVTWQLKALTEQAARELRRPNRGPPTCRFCKKEHPTSDCNVIPQLNKIQETSRLHICRICLTSDSHHPTNCRNLRNSQLLCKHVECGKRYHIHHISICPYTMVDNISNEMQEETVLHEEPQKNEPIIEGP
ncbi:unnamed protein product [Caenorhabditis sp. 36 PRJEB53466]|nr:unnamed protein product [Caenorhabditis sp. 36 PRJEB53466]